jgi:hypothetical protein
MNNNANQKEKKNNALIVKRKLRDKVSKFIKINAWNDQLSVLFVEKNIPSAC